MTFLLRLLGLSLVALFTGALLFAAAQFVINILIVNTVLLGGLGGLLAYLLAQTTSWRPSRARTVSAALTGVLAYLARFYVLLLYAAGPAAVFRFDLVPLVIQDLMLNQQWADEGVNVARNVSTLIVETAITAGIFALCMQIDKDVVPKAVCPRCGRNAKSKTVLLPPEYAAELQAALDNDDWDALPIDASNGEIEGDAWSSVRLEYCFHGEEEPLLVLSAKQTAFASGQSLVAIVLEPREISAETLLKIAAKVPALAVAD